MINNKIYRDLLDTVIQQILGNKVIKSNLIYIGLVGSLNSNQASEGWSDLDLILILKSDEYGNIDFSILDEIKRVHNAIQNKTNIEISFLTHTAYELINYVSFEYLINYSFASSLYPDNSTYLKDLISKIIKERDISIETKKRYAIYHTRHKRFNVLRKYVSTSGNTKSIAKLFIDKLIEMTILINIYDSELTNDKKQLIENAKIKLNDSLVSQTLDTCFDYRNRWSEMSDTELEKFLPTCVKCMNRICELMLKKYNLPTPEESLAVCKYV